MKRYFQNDEAARIGETTQNIVMDMLRSALLASPDFGAAGALTPGGVLVTNSLATASARFKTADNQAFVLLMQSAHQDAFQRVQLYDNSNTFTGVSPGRRHEWKFSVQLSARNDLAARTGPGNTPALDRKLADFVVATFGNQYRALQQLGVFETIIHADGDNQANPNCINPHVLKCSTYTVDPS